MEREELLKAIRSGPIEIVMNSGDRFAIPSSDFAIVDSVAAHVLYKAEDGKMRTAILPLVTMSVIHTMDASPGT